MKEKWAEIPGYEGSYQVSDQGRVRSLDRWVKDRNGNRRYCKGRVLRQSFKGAYPKVSLGANNTKLVATLVALAFIGPRPDGKEVCHGDGDPGNSRLKNLRYGTPLENHADKRKHGTILTGAKHQNCIVTDQQVVEIHALGKGEIGPWADANGISRGHVYNIRAKHRR